MALPDRLLPLCDLLLGAAHADKQLQDRERDEVRELLADLAGAALTAEVEDRLAKFDAAHFDLAIFGNPNLEQETAWGYDIGYEHRIGQRGVIGFNYFHRDIENLISLINTGVSTGVPGAFEYTFENTGDGEVLRSDGQCLDGARRSLDDNVRLEGGVEPARGDLPSDAREDRLIA